MKGIILAGGAGTRLYPATLACSKQMLPIYDKPMIYYPLSVLMLAGIRDILIISTPRDIVGFEELLKDGHQLGLNLQYVVQQKPRGLADAFILGKEFIGKDNVCLILGDNIFYGHDLTKMVQASAQLKTGAEFYGFMVPNPKSFGVAVLDPNDPNKLIAIEEKPEVPKSNLAVTGLYFYDNDVVKIAENVKPSARGEIEITSINNEYIRRGKAKINNLGRGFAWLDTGTHKNMLDASHFIEMVQTRTGCYVACLEEIAYRKGYINGTQLLEAAEKQKSTDYGKYLRRIYEENKNLDFGKQGTTRSRNA